MIIVSSNKKTFVNFNNITCFSIEHLGYDYTIYAHYSNDEGGCNMGSYKYEKTAIARLNEVIEGIKNNEQVIYMD